MKNISLINLTVQNATYSGVFISGANGLNNYPMQFQRKWSKCGARAKAVT